MATTRPVCLELLCSLARAGLHHLGRGVGGGKAVGEGVDASGPQFLYLLQPYLQ
jgi:hypothetical protein